MVSISRSGIVVPVDYTEDDIRTAKLATELLAEQGYPDLSVSTEQLVRWRQKADAIPVRGSRRGGRSQRVHYMPSAPAVAAGLALALSEDRDLDRAVLDVFGNDLPVPEKAVRAAYVHALQKQEGSVRKGWARRFEKRSDLPRSLRTPVPHPHQGDAWMISDTVLSVLIGETPLTGNVGAGVAIEELLGELAPTDAGDKQRMVDLLGCLKLAAVRRTAAKGNMDRIAESCAHVRSLVGYAEAMGELCRITDGKVSTIAGPDGILLAFSGWLASLSVFRRQGVNMALWGLIFEVVGTDAGGRRQLEERAEAAIPLTGQCIAVTALAESLPDNWRPALAPVTGSVYLATLPQGERDELADTIRRWRLANPTADRALLVPPAPGELTP